jgi:ArsR family metal-binding transcriptional regulator
LRIEDEKEAEGILKWLQDLINETYEKRDQIEPNYSMAAELKGLDIFKLLPGTNWKKRGELTCLAFAVKLVGRDTEISKCDPLFSAKYQAKRNVLLELVQAAGCEAPITRKEAKIS